MGLLYDAAAAWNSLQNTSYCFLLGRRGTWSSSVHLDFRPEDFPHLAGMQYAGDIDFRINKAEMRGRKFLPKIISGKIEDERIEKSANWESKIRGRLKGILSLEELLDSDFLIYRFDPKKVPYGTKIEAQYVVKDTRSGTAVFVFVDSSRSRWFCRSIFQSDHSDYAVNQMRVSVLKKQKRIGTEVVLDHVNPNYRETPQQSRAACPPAEAEGAPSGPLAVPGGRSS